MSVLEFIDNKTIDTNVDCKKRDDVLSRIAALAKSNSILNEVSEEEIFGSLQAREGLGTTGFGDGIAIPHCSFPDISDFVVGFVRMPKGADFDSIDGKPVDVAFFIIGPEAERNRHIQILSTISKILAAVESAKDLRNAKDADEVLGIIRKECETEPEIHQLKERCLFTIVIQREEYFDKVMQILSSDVEGEIAVIEGQNAGHYLHRMPLFSAYWSEDSGRFTRIILAVADRGVCNDIIRRIYLISDNIEREGGILVTAQDLMFAGGSLDF